MSNNGPFGDPQTHYFYGNANGIYGRTWTTAEKATEQLLGYRPVYRIIPQDLEIAELKKQVAGLEALVGTLEKSAEDLEARVKELEPVPEQATPPWDDYDGWSFEVFERIKKSDYGDIVVIATSIPDQVTARLEFSFMNY